MSVATMPTDELSTVLEPRPLPNFVETGQIRGISERALAYIRAGFPIHFRGVSGTGKTTLAMHVASKIARPVVMIHGDEEFSTSDLVGGEYGYRIRKVVDNFIHSVLKTEEDMQRRWVDNRLTVACKYGFTLIYDEFTRSRPEANNTLLSVLQEKMLDLPSARGGGESYLRVNPDFTAIFTSNPEEYAGVYRSQDALRDRMITMDLAHYDRETEIEITQAKAGLAYEDAEKLIDVVRGLRESGKYEYAPTIRAPMMIGKTLKVRGGRVSADDPIFRETVVEILTSETTRVGSTTHQAKVQEVVNDLIDQTC
ncbi:gas vesicle protein GvpN [Acidobacteria bacterium AH-259-D05]|nr:gas vesicle protein GvpN [Acidobacteria bacterium AH-259-D05]